MTDLTFPSTAGALAAAFGARLVGDSELAVRGLSSLEQPKAETLSFLASRSYARFLPRAHQLTLFTTAEYVRPELPITFLVVDDPQNAFAQTARCFMRRKTRAEISPLATIHPTAEIDSSCSIGPYVVIEARVMMGPGTVTYPHVHICEEVKIGADCEIHSHATIREQVRLGDRVRVGASSVIGSEGFGYFVPKGESCRREMPQIGTVVVENDVRIGASVTIDRGTLAETRIGSGSIIDNQVHIGHNCKIGCNVVLCAQVGLSGSVVLEDGVILGGQVGIGQGVIIGKGARLGGQTGTSTNLKGDTQYFLTPALPMRDVIGITKYLRKLPQIWKKVQAIEDKLKL